MNVEQMAKLSEAAALLRQAKAIVDAVGEAADKEQKGLPERLHSTSIDDEADATCLSLEHAAEGIGDALASIAEVTGEDDLKPSDRAAPLAETFLAKRHLRRRPAGD